MRKSTLFSLLTMLLLFVGNNVWADETWVKTEPTDLQTGDVVAIVDLTKELVMPNNNGAGKAPVATAITFKSDKTEIADVVDETWQWVVTVNEATYQFGVEGTEDYLYCTNTNNGVRVGTNTNNEFIMKDNFLFNKATSRYIGPYNTQDWRCYTSINSNIQGTEIAFFKKVDDGGGVTVAKPVITPRGGTFYEPREVVITSEGNTIYYTLDGTEPSDASTQYTAPFIVSESCTVNAIAYDDNDNASAIATAEFVIKTAAKYDNIAELCAAATDTEETVIVEFNGWICTGVKGANAYFTDGKNGIQLYQSGHGFEQGDMLKGSAQVQLVLYKECAEIKGLTSTTEGLSVEKGVEATPLTVAAVIDLEKDMQGCLIRLEGVTYSEGVFLDGDDNPITPYNTFTKLPELLEGKIYNVTGVAIWFVPSNGSGYWEICPRTADEFELVTSQILPLSSWSVEEETVDINGTPTAVFTTTSDGEVTYESSNENVATIDSEGKITLVGKGTTTITAKVAETDMYLPDSKSFKLTVTVEGYMDVVFAYNDEDIQGQGESGAKGVGFTATRDDIVTLTTNNAYGNSSYIQIYGSKYEKVGEGDEAEQVLSEPSYIQLAVPEGCVITEIVLTATSDSYIKSWKDESGADAVIDGVTATWTGEQTNVVLTNQETSQARLKTIAVTYFIVDPDGIETLSASSVKVDAIYNLAGQRMTMMQKGINIMGGKKVLVK